MDEDEGPGWQSERGLGCVAFSRVTAGLTASAQQPPQSLRVAPGAALEVVVEIGRDCFRTAGADMLRPRLKFRVRVIVAIPLGRAMEADIDGIGGLDHVIRQTRRAHGTENQAGVTKRREHVLVPPTGMAERDGVGFADHDIVIAMVNMVIMVDATRPGKRTIGWGEARTPTFGGGEVNVGVPSSPQPTIPSH